MKGALERVLASEQLGKSETSRRLLGYLVGRALRNDAPKETEIALDVFGKGATFNGSDDSVVRVSVRTLRQKLTEYYAGPAGAEELHFEIPKGGYRLVFVPSAVVAPPVSATSTASSSDTPSSPAPATASASDTRWPRAARWLATAALAILVVSVAANVYQWKAGTPAANPQIEQVRGSQVWADVAASRRPLTIVLGDLFMYTQTDPVTGRTITVRDTGINTSEELRAFLASNPSYAAERGQRYVTMIQKSAAIGMASILPLVNREGRSIDVTVGDDVREDAIRHNDVIYIGPLARTGPLAGYYQLRSRYRFNPLDSSITDTATGKVLKPAGELGSQHTDYALAAKFLGPGGNHILIFTSGARNAGLLQIVRTMTSPEGIAAFESKLNAQASGAEEFEALLTVTGFKTTDLAAEVLEVHPMPRAAASR